MKKLLISAAATSVMVSACASTDVRTTTNTFTAPDAETQTLMFNPDVQMFSILASGVLEPRAKWSESAQKNLNLALQQQLQARNSSVVFMEEDATLSDKQVQLLKLKDAVLAANVQYKQLKNKKDVFDLTLGPEANLLAGETGADFALLSYARGSFQSAGKVLVNAALIALTAYAGGAAFVQTGQQTATISLVDLSNGDIVWTNSAVLGAGADPRSEKGAQSVAKTLLKDFPL